MRDKKYRGKRSSIKRVVKKGFPVESEMARQVCSISINYAGQRPKEIGIQFGVKESGVSYASRRLGKHMSRNTLLRKKVSTIKKALLLVNV